MEEYNGSTQSFSNGSDLLAQVSRKVEELHRGGAQGAGSWLTSFQRSDCAWQVCVDVLKSGPSPERVTLQFFAAQTLVRVSRAFTTRLPRDCWASRREELAGLLLLHSVGAAVVWRQLVLALTCADLWLGTWSATGPLSATSLPLAVRCEMLALPPELLFCERALPLDDSALWQKSAAALEECCGGVFSFLLNELDASGAAASLSALAAWLRALRKGVEWLPHSDVTMPLKALAPLQQRLLVLARAAPPQAAEVAQQLALWRCPSEGDVLFCLQPLLADVLPSLLRSSDHAALLSLLSDLATDRWPRAVVGECPLDWQLITTAALDLLGAAAAKTAQDDLAGCEAEDTFGVWLLMAKTLRQGTWDWKAKPEQLSTAPTLGRCFELFCQRVVAVLTFNANPQNTNVEAVLKVREAAESAVAEWAAIFGATPSWDAAIWQPLRLVGNASADESPSSILQLCQGTEVAMWWAATLAASAHEKGPACAGSAVLELRILDNAPLPWRALLWASGCNLASTARGDVSLQLLEWMLKRSPGCSHTEVPWLLYHTELLYAQQVELLSRQVPKGSHLQHAEQIAVLAMEPIRGALHEDSARARGLLLGGCRRVLGGNAAQVCACLSQSVLAPLRQAVETEAQNQGGGGQWPAVQVLCAALGVTLPDGKAAEGLDSSNGASSVQAAVSIWEANWDMMQAALLTWATSPTTNQPVEAASEALAEGALKLPPMLKPALGLLVQSITSSSQPHAQIHALRRIVADLSVSPQELAGAAALLAEALLAICKSTLSREGLGQSPILLEALFRLLATSIQMAPKSTPAAMHLREGHLRPQLLGQAGLVKLCLEVVAGALPECPTPGGVEWTLVFVARLLKGLKSGSEVDPNLRETMRLALPHLCLAITRALACQPQLTKVESVHYAAEVLLQVAEVFPQDAEAALSNGLERLAGLGVPDYSRHRLARHVHQRPQWANLGAWIDGLQQIAFDWQNERRQSIT